MSAPTPATTPTAESDALAAGFPQASYEQWRALVDKALKGADFEKRLVAKTADGIAIRPLYVRADELPASADARPGAAPFTRGARSARAGLGWDIRSICIEQEPGANAAILEDLEGGVNSIALQIGGPGLPATKEALATALDGVVLDACPIALVAEHQAFTAAATLMSVWTARGVAPEARLGSFGADPLGVLARSGWLTDDIETELARAVALMKLAEASSGVTAMTADGTAYHNGGASEAQELALMLATLVVYLRAAERGDIAPADALAKINVSLAADADEFSTVAKMRAARRLIWRAADACGAGDAAAKVQLVTPTSYRMMAKRDAWTNILRTTIACAGAALGGADSIVVLPFTFALGKPDAFARRVARNVQIVCQEESHLGRVADPAGGSWYVEKLTDDMAKKAWEIFQDIERRGGMLEGVTSGSVQDMIAKTAAARAQAIATGKQPLTGISAFPILGDDGVHADAWPEAAATKPAKPALEAAPIRPRRLAENFEALRDAAGGYTVFLASLGEIVDHNVRTTWAKNYLAAGGIATLISDGYKSGEAASEAFKASGAKAACICSSDAIYAKLAEPTARALKSAGASFILMVGKPGDTESALKDAGVDQFVFAGADAVATLKGLHGKLSAIS